MSLWGVFIGPENKTLTTKNISGKGSSSCKKDYNMIGCYEENNPGVAIFDDKHSVDWNNIVDFMSRYKSRIMIDIDLCSHC